MASQSNLNLSISIPIPISISNRVPWKSIFKQQGKKFKIKAYEIPTNGVAPATDEIPKDEHNANIGPKMSVSNF